MKNLLTASLALLSLGLFSCQKEVTDIFNNSGSSSGSQLVKIISKSGSDSSAMSFGYNSSKKLTDLNSFSVTGGTTSSFSMRAVRNAQGIIQKVIIKSDQYKQYGLDSVITAVTYQAGHYSTEVTTIDLGGISAADSVSLSYDAGGKVIKEESFFVALGSADTMSKTEYTYNGNNISTMNTYSYDASTSSYKLVDTYNYDPYDDKQSPMYFGNDAFVFGSPLFNSYNNPLKSSQTVLGATQTYTVTYTYNSANKPATAISTIQPGNTTATGTYYYQ